MRFWKGLDKDYLDGLFRASLLGIHLVIATFLGLIAGYYLDKWLHTKPWFTLLFLFFGIAAGFRNMFREAALIRKGEKRRDKDKD